MKDLLGQKGFIKNIPEGYEEVEAFVGMELVVAGEVADMWLVERQDGCHTYIPKECFSLYIEANITDHLDDCMMKINDVIHVAEHQGKHQLALLLHDIKERINDLSIDFDEESA